MYVQLLHTTHSPKALIKIVQNGHKSQIASHRKEQIIMHFTTVGTIMLCLMATVPGSSLRERGLYETMKSSPKGKHSQSSSKKSKGGNDCSFTRPKKAAIFGLSFLANVWDSILDTDCSLDAMKKVYLPYLDEDAVVTVGGETVATNRENASDVLANLSEDLCTNLATYVSWIIRDAVIDSDEKNKVTLVTNEVVSVPPANYTCDIGYTFAFEVSGKGCNTVKVTAVAIGETSNLLPTACSR